MSHIEDEQDTIVPAHLNYLTIYSPNINLGEADENDQILFKYSAAPNRKLQKGRRDGDTDHVQDVEGQEHLRRVGLAQGMVNFARTFASGGIVDSVETDKHRIVMTEIESGWWILAYVKFTAIPAPNIQSNHTDNISPSFEYSSREVSPPALLLKQLSRAYRIFLLHQGSSLSDVYVRLPRARFCNLLENYWTRFARTWDVLLHSNPAAELYGGTKLSVGGELGVGVGEEDYGSGEREVLEGMVRSTDGLVDVVVSRFGDDPFTDEMNEGEQGLPVSKAIQVPTTKWPGSMHPATSDDGVIFAGVGALARSSLEVTSNWVEDVHMYGDLAYGIKENPTSGRKRQRRRHARTDNTESDNQKEGSSAAEGMLTRPQTPPFAPSVRPNIPPPIVSAVEESLEQASVSQDAQDNAVVENQAYKSLPSSLSASENWMRYLTLGYTSTWPRSARRTFSSAQADGERRSTLHSTSNQPVIRRGSLRDNDCDGSGVNAAKDGSQQSQGRFLIGLTNLTGDQPSPNEDTDVVDWNSRISVRTLHVKLTESYQSFKEQPEELEDTQPGDDIPSSSNPSKPSEFQRLRVVLYVHQPFIFTLLFVPATSNLTLPFFYQSLHRTLSALHNPLLHSTSPHLASARLSTLNPYIQSAKSSPIHSLIHDPMAHTLHSTIPTIPYTHPSPSSDKVWTRAEALATHQQILAAYIATRRHPGELERTAKTSRNWWVVWMRLPPDADANADAAEEDVVPDPVARCREAVLVRRAGDSVAVSETGREVGRATSWGGMVGRSFGVGTASAEGASTREEGLGKTSRAGWAPVKLAEGIGVDARRYVDGLLNLNR